MDLCRDYEYYVDPLSEEAVELGTKKYPYKDLEAVFSEILHLHSNQHHEIKVFIKEGTRNYLHLAKSYIINAGMVKISTYAEGIVDPGRALVIGTDDTNSIPIPVISTMFKVLQTNELPFLQKLVEYGELATNKTSIIVEESRHLAVVNTTFTLDQIDFTTDYSSDYKTHKFIELVHQKHNWFNLSSSYIDVAGNFLTANDQSRIKFEYVTLDCYRAYYMVRSETYCSNSSELYEGEFHAYNISFLFTQAVIYPHRTLVVRLLGGANIYLNNIYAAVTPNNVYTLFYINFDEACKYPNGISPVIKLENSVFTSKYGRKHQSYDYYYPIIARSATYSAPYNTSIYINNVKMYGMNMYEYLLNIEIGANSDLYISNFTAEDVRIDYGIAFTLNTARNVVMNNVTLNSIVLLASQLFQLSASSLELNHFSMSNLVGYYSEIEYAIEIYYGASIKLSL